jgi:hypothetical protein
MIVGDLQHEWRSDLVTNSTGDLALTTNGLRGQQRLLRRLLTNLGDYIWHLDYGGGLGSYVGECADVSGLAAIIKSQMLLESSVSWSPEPRISVTQPAPGGESLCVQIQYMSVEISMTEVLVFSLNSTSL